MQDNFRYKFLFSLYVLSISFKNVNQEEVQSFLPQGKECVYDLLLQMIHATSFKTCSESSAWSYS